MKTLLIFLFTVLSFISFSQKEIKMNFYQVKYTYLRGGNTITEVLNNKNSVTEVISCDNTYVFDLENMMCNIYNSFDLVATEKINGIKKEKNIITIEVYSGRNDKRFNDYSSVYFIINVEKNESTLHFKDPLTTIYEVYESPNTILSIK
jgi:hypothetical protein